MADNYLERLVAEWYEYQGYFVRRNVHVGKRPQGGYECELDVVAFHPGRSHLVHAEPSMDADSWEVREQRFGLKFAAGRKYITGIFKGMAIPSDIDQIAVLAFGSKKTHPTLAGGRVVLVKELIEDMIKELAPRGIMTEAIPEHLPILRTLQFVCEYKNAVRGMWGAAAGAKSRRS